MLALLALFPCLFDCLTARHSSIIVKRKAPQGKLYVFSQREGCVSIQSNATCPVTWKLDPYSAKLYEKQNEVVSKTVILKIYEELGASADCQENFRTVWCSQYIARCLANGSRDYGNVREKCEKLYTTCPTLVVVSFKRNRQGIFNYITGGAKAPPAPMVAPLLNHFGPPSQSPFSLKYKQNMEFRREV